MDWLGAQRMRGRAARHQPKRVRGVGPGTSTPRRAIDAPGSDRRPSSGKMAQMNVPPASAREANPPFTLTWVGHATALIELDGLRILTDPLLRDRVGPLRRIAPPVGSDVGERIDLIILSHLHADHTDLPSLLQVGSETPVLAPRGAGDWLARHGMSDVRELSAGEEATVGSVRIAATPAEHDGRRWPFGARADPIGFVARGSQTFYFAGDTDLFDEMSALAGAIDLALIPIWGWGPTLGPGHLDPERAARAAAAIAPGLAVPIHWGTYAPGRPAPRPRDPGAPARRFSAMMAREAPAVELRVLAPGERIELPPRERVAGRVRGEGS